MKLLYVVVLISALGCCTAADTKEVNELMDQFVLSMRKAINISRINEVKISDWRAEWPYRWQNNNWRGKFKCHDGAVKYLNSLTRNGDISLKTAAGKTILTAHLFFDNLMIKFENCEFAAPHLYEQTTVMKAKVPSNSVELQVSLTREGEKCDASLVQIELDDVGKIMMENLPEEVREFEKKFNNWTSDYFHKYVIPSINPKLSDAFNKALLKIDLCSKILPPQ